jgi:hypothetical protein
LVNRLVVTVSAADRTSAQLAEEPDLAGERAAKLTRNLVALNTSASALLTKLRLTPQAAHSRRAEGFNGETAPHVLSDPLIGVRLRQ